MTKLRELVTVICLVSLSIISACQDKQKNINYQFDELSQKIIASEIEISPETYNLNSSDFPEIFTGDDTSLKKRSRAALLFNQVKRLEYFEALMKFPINALSPQNQQTHNFLNELLSNTIQVGTYAYGFADLENAHPYYISHLDAAFINLPTFLATRHEINALYDAQEYIERLQQVPDAIRDEFALFKDARHNGILPPRFSLEQALAQARDIRNQPAEKSRYITPLQYGLEYLDNYDQKAASALLSQAIGIVENSIYPVYDSLIAELEDVALSAPINSGIASLPNGRSYYQDLIRYNTGLSHTPDEIHQMGLDLVAELTLQIYTMLDALELEDGDLTTRLNELDLIEGQLFENSEGGHDALLDYAKQHVSKLRTLVGPAFQDVTIPPIIIDATPTHLEETSTGIFYEAALNNADEIASLHINMSDVSVWPQWSIPTRLHMKVIPGQHLENAVIAQKGIPAPQRTFGFRGFSDAWSVYAQDLADEMGVYTDDPYGRIGYLQSLLFHSAKLVVDTGMNSQGWSREQAVDYVIQTTGMAEDVVIAEIDRTSVRPAQALTYMLGRQEIRRLRDIADNELGIEFDISEFHALILGAGPRPFNLVSKDFEVWLANKTSRPAQQDEG